MKKTFILLFALLISGGLFAQCIPDPGPTSMGLHPQTLLDANAGSAYSDTITLVLPSDTVFLGFLIPVDSAIITDVSGLPAGLSYQLGSGGDPVYSPGSGQMIRECILISGTPTTPIDNDTIVISYEIWVTLLGMSQSLPMTEEAYITVLSGAGLKENVFSGLNVFPNPTYGKLNIDFGRELKSPVLRILDMSGRVLDESQYIFVQNIELKLEGESGFYIVEITENDQVQRLKVLKY